MSTLNERISEWFEPFESLPDPTKWDTTIKGEYSPKRIWVMGYSTAGRAWLSQRIQWDTDEAANARLLEAMPGANLYLHEGRWFCFCDATAGDDEETDSEDRKIAIRMAFCKFAGIEED